ncbi:MAG: amino acid permease [Flavobacteriales bacterium]|nr:amino acid permease [Flavobacteriales bacterium]
MAQKYTRSVATNMVIANMIGTGIFTSLGYQVLSKDFGGIPDPFSILMIWLLGGIVSLCGATVYGEVATRVNRSGGEYAFLSDIYHPILGFLSGWVSLFVGFSAAIASLALATGEYFLPILNIPNDPLLQLGFLEITPSKLVGISVLIIVLLVQLRGVKWSGIFQNVMTYVKLILIATFLLIPFIFLGDYEASGISFSPTEDSSSTIFSLAFAGSLVYVMFAYSGWNASTYIVGNMENPKKNLPFSLIVGTIVVTVIYILMNFVFMYVASFDELAGQVDLGNIVANKILGTKVGLVFSLVFSLALISGVNAMFIAAPRVAEQIGKDYTAFKALGKQSKNGAPKNALFFIFVISLLLVVFSSFQEIIQYIGITLSMFSLLTVFGVFILRHREKKSGEYQSHFVKSWGYPVTPIVFILVTLWMISFFVFNDPMILVWSLITLIPAVIIFYATQNKTHTNDSVSVDDRDK